MKTYQEMSKEELTQELTALKAEYEKIKAWVLHWICPEESREQTSLI